MIRNRMPGSVVAIVAGVVAVSVGGLGVAQGSPDTSGYPAKAAKGKKRHKLDVTYKSGQIDVIDEATPTADVVFQAYSKLQGRPFGAFKAKMNEERFFRYKVPVQMPRTDYSGTAQVTFTADVFGGSRPENGKFRGFWNYSVDSEGDVVGPVTGVITSGSGKFKGAGGRFDVLNLHNTSNDPVHQEATWKGFIRY